MCSTNTINVFIVSVRNVKYGHRIPAHWQRVSELCQRKRVSKLRSLYLSSVAAVNPDLCTFDGNPVKFDFVSIRNGNPAIANYICVHIFPFSGNTNRETKATENAPDGIHDGYAALKQIRTSSINFALATIIWFALLAAYLSGIKMDAVLPVSTYVAHVRGVRW